MIDMIEKSNRARISTKKKQAEQQAAARGPKPSFAAAAHGQGAAQQQVCFVN